MKRVRRAKSIATLAFAIIASASPTSTPARAAGVSLVQSHRDRELNFADRVAYQYAIEEVYWRHRIWPKENPGLKPSLDTVMSPAQIVNKVEDYVRQSEVLDEWQAPLTHDQLQAEMDRMAHGTRQPEALRELFAALGNDPFLIAECLARAVLAERVLGEIRLPQAVQSPDPELQTQVAAKGARTSIDYTLPVISSAPDSCADDSWTATSLINVPAGRTDDTVVWTGTEMIVWGGVTSSYTRTGSRYNPTTDTWTATTLTGAPGTRAGHTAVWTGTEMIVWGGQSNNAGLNTGGRYNPMSNSWTATTISGAPPARFAHTTVWSGTEMIVWGGAFGSEPMNTGGRYNPATNSWILTSTINAPSARSDHTGVWADGEMIIWGGDYIGQLFNTGGRYKPSTDSWIATNTGNAPAARASHTAIWTGDEMIVWGGSGSGIFNTGGRYNPGTDSWTNTSTIGAADGRYYHTAVWTGSEMIVWGGRKYPSSVNTGARYNPNSDSWTSTSTTNAPIARDSHTAIFTGSEMIIWGGYDGSGRANSGGRYCVESTPIVHSAASRKSHGTAGDFDVDLPLSGTAGVECRAGGATNDYTIIVTFLANISVNGNPQATISSGIGEIGSGGVSNGGIVATAGNVVTVPLTNVANAQTITVTLNNVNGSTNVTIPMRVLIGDVNGNGAVNATDITLTKSRLGQPINATTFRSDVNADGGINSTDVSIIKSRIGTGLP